MPLEINQMLYATLQMHSDRKKNEILAYADSSVTSVNQKTSR